MLGRANHTIRILACMRRTVYQASWSKLSSEESGWRKVRRPFNAGWRRQSLDPRVETTSMTFFLVLLFACLGCMTWEKLLNCVVSFLKPWLRCSAPLEYHYVSCIRLCRPNSMQQRAQPRESWSVCSGPFCRARGGYSHEAFPLPVKETCETGREEEMISQKWIDLDALHNESGAYRMLRRHAFQHPGFGRVEREFLTDSPSLVDISFVGRTSHTERYLVILRLRSQVARGEGPEISVLRHEVLGLLYCSMHCVYLLTSSVSHLYTNIQHNKQYIMISFFQFSTGLRSRFEISMQSLMSSWAKYLSSIPDFSHLCRFIHAIAAPFEYPFSRFISVIYVSPTVNLGKFVHAAIDFDDSLLRMHHSVLISHCAPLYQRANTLLLLCWLAIGERVVWAGRRERKRLERGVC